MLELNKINITINDKKILQNINIKFDSNFLAIFGESGSGKTTLLNSIIGNIKLLSGKILLDNEDITNKKLQDRDIGIVFQDLVLFPNKTILENINIGKNINIKVRDFLIKEFGIQSIINNYPNEISGGEQQRVSLIRTLVTMPKLLLLDEPFSSLDQINKDIIQKELKEILLKLDIPTIFVTHDKNDIFFFDADVIILKDGKISQSGYIEDVYNNTTDKYIAKLFGEINIINNKYIRPENIILKKICKNNENDYYIADKINYGIYIKYTISNNKNSYISYSQTDFNLLDNIKYNICEKKKN